MDIVWWILIVICFVLAFVGIVFPIIPSVLVIWIGFLLYQFLLTTDNIGWIFWIAMVLWTLILIFSDIIANSYFVKRFGGSKNGERLAAVGVIVGSFIIPPFGIIIVPFLLVVLTELIQKRAPKDAFRAALGSLIGFLSGTFAKIIIQLIMIIWFFIAI
ncbi:hypothetical protein JCM21714_2576 [Gracilibacillus boraciitolerans JCM 21714]|uniref:Uncharacterized protein n=1 Tax=Gracilibacillus boraciitolerans JCM 21714 TaxID=1298598 RepID=W4VK26_9BACI|nr:DUF456 family protein [Gracilibacillus boraciitolerans]GAE93491.1 hypothetical protein JCM21714_2576 [Gracilibacillus boraciitolerans JCM 21714]